MINSRLHDHMYLLLLHHIFMLYCTSIKHKGSISTTGMSIYVFRLTRRLHTLEMVWLALDLAGLCSCGEVLRNAYTTVARSISKAEDAQSLSHILDITSLQPHLHASTCCRSFLPSVSSFDLSGHREKKVRP